MATGLRKCRVCGKEYEYCYTLRRNPNIYRWQDVACCEEHGFEYLKSIMESRGENASEDVVTAPTEERVEEAVASTFSETPVKSTDVEAPTYFTKKKKRHYEG